MLSRIADRFGWQVWAYCLMDNHYHLLVETPQANLSRGMRELNGVYTQAFDRRHARVEHVLQGWFKGLLVDKDAYLAGAVPLRRAEPGAGGHGRACSRLAVEQPAGGDGLAARVRCAGRGAAVEPVRRIVGSCAARVCPICRAGRWR